MSGRIKGANSDYRYAQTADGQGGIEAVQGEDAYLQIFLCPVAQPSRVEENSGNYCEGTAAQCPASAPGHALLHLHEKTGVSLVADNGNRLVVDQEGQIRLLAPQAIRLQVGQVELIVREQAIELTGLGSGQVIVNGSLQVNGELRVSGDLTVGGTITGDGALTEAHKQLLEQLAGGGGG